MATALHCDHQSRGNAFPRTRTHPGPPRSAALQLGKSSCHRIGLVTGTKLGQPANSSGIRRSHVSENQLSPDHPPDRTLSASLDAGKVSPLSPASQESFSARPLEAVSKTCISRPTEIGASDQAIQILHPAREPSADRGFAPPKRSGPPECPPLWQRKNQWSLA